jgi:dienelactone hydrolase
MMRKTPLLLFIVALLLAACVPLPPVTPPPPTILPNPSPAALAAPVAVEYNLGETTITQARFPEDSRFRNMPVRLNGVIAAPTGGTGPFPVILILHGTHPGCPAVGEVDAWPCGPDVEQRNYRGFAYLTEALAEQGYVALSININAEYTFGFGEVGAGERLNQIVERHLAALATASAGGENNFGVELDGVADMERLGLAGHSRGAELAVMLARESQAEATKGVLQIAPSPVLIDPAPGLPVPLGAVQAMCDGDVQDISGQVFYEALRLAEGQSAWANSVFLERANHNGFNTMLDGDPFGLRGRPDCGSLLAPEQQQAFLSAYAAAFFDAVFLEGALA